MPRRVREGVQAGGQAAQGGGDAARCAASARRRARVKRLAQPEPKSNTTPREFHEMVDKAKEYIRAGDISPGGAVAALLGSVHSAAVLRFIGRCAGSIHRRSCSISISVASPLWARARRSSLRVRDGEVTIRPIAGTAPRGATEAEDKALGEALLKDPKERAEHLMLLDLGRNDVGRVAEVGSVEVTAKFVVERYSHVHAHRFERRSGGSMQIARCRRRADGRFPAGTVSGAPKVRAMEVIDELEKSKRGPYAGCVGYFTSSGEMDTCIVLRTALIKDGKPLRAVGCGRRVRQRSRERAAGMHQQGQGRSCGRPRKPCASPRAAPCRG